MGGTRKTNVMVEFSEEVYDSLVEPMKKNKSFSKLVAALIEGYINDSYVRAYADDTLYDLKRASVDAFNESLDSMSESLSNMGLYTDELESTAMMGKKKFREKADRYSGEYYRDSSRRSSEPTKKDDTSEINELKKQINDMQSSFNDTLKNLMDMMKSNQVQSQGMYGVMPMNPMNMYPNGYMGMYGQVPYMGMPIQQGNISMQGSVPMQNISNMGVNMQGANQVQYNPATQMQNMQGQNISMQSQSVPIQVQGTSGQNINTPMRNNGYAQQDESTQNYQQQVVQNVKEVDSSVNTSNNDKKVSSPISGSIGRSERPQSEGGTSSNKGNADDDLAFNSNDYSIFDSFGDTNLSVGSGSEDSTSDADEVGVSEARDFMSSMLEGNAFEF